MYGRDGRAEPGPTARLRWRKRTGGSRLMLLSLSDLVSTSLLWHQDRNQQALRAKYQSIDDVLYNKHPIDVPPDMVGRAMPFYTGVAMEKMTRAAALLTDREGLPKITVPAMGAGIAQRDRAERVQSWVLSALRWVSYSGQDSLDALITWDLLLRSHTWVSVLPMPALWGPLAQARPDDDEPDLDSAGSMNEVWERVGEYLATVDDVERTARAQDNIRRSTFPIVVRHVPGEHVIAQWKQGLLKEVREYQQVPVSFVLNTYVDLDGKPLAEHLARTAEIEELTDSDVCTLLIRTDQHHMQVAVLDFILQGQTTTLGHQFHGVEEIIWEGEHGMGCVPYAYFPGRTTAAKNLANRYYGFVDNIVGANVHLDYLVTERNTTTRTVAWPHLYVERSHQLVDGSIGSGDRPPPIEIREGGVFAGLGPGEKFSVIPWGTAEGYRLLDQAESAAHSYIDRHTFGPSMYGAPSGDSGYMLAQMQAAAESVLAPFKIGKVLGYQRLCQLLVRAARWLIDAGCGPIPVRYTSTDGMRWVEMTDDLVNYDWEFMVEIDARPIGGDQALLTMLRGAEDAGYIAHTTAMSRFGVRDVQQEMYKIFGEKALFAPETQQQVLQPIIAAILGALAKPQQPKLPEQPVIPAALAGVIGRSPDPAAAAAQVRMPDGEMMPSPAEKLRATGNPTPGEFRRQGGQQAGMPAPVPGGMERMAGVMYRKGGGLV